MTLNPRPGPRFPSKTAPGPRGESAARALKPRSAPKNSRRNGKKFQRGAGDGGTRPAGPEGRDGARRSRGSAGSPWRICTRPRASRAARPPRGEGGRALRAVMVRTSQWAAGSRGPRPIGGGRGRGQRGRRHRPPARILSAGRARPFCGGERRERDRHRHRDRDRDRGATPGSGPGSGSGSGTGGGGGA